MNLGTRGSRPLFDTFLLSISALLLLLFSHHASWPLVFCVLALFFAYRAYESCAHTDESVHLSASETDSVRPIDHHSLMIQAISHDLKTPLTRAMLKLHLFPETDPNTHSLEQDLNEINEIIDSALAFSRPEKLNTVSIELLSLIESLCEHYISSSFKIRVESTLDHVMVQGDTALLKRLFNNLFDNARKYASACRVYVQEDGHDAVRIDIQDNGPGVPEKVIEHLSKPYFRADPSRSRASGGSGLGLSIVSRILGLHGGSIMFKNTKEGFRASIRLSVEYHQKPRSEHVIIK